MHASEINILVIWIQKTNGLIIFLTESRSALARRIGMYSTVDLPLQGTA
jgi:hypothetical protein